MAKDGSTHPALSSVPFSWILAQRHHLPISASADYQKGDRP
jgi:hypothetical protein